MFYLNFILPPIIIISSVALVLFIISRKTLNDTVIVDDNGDETEGLKADIKTGGLNFLERISRKSKIIFLKLHNASEKWSQSIREKKRKREGTVNEESMKVNEKQNRKVKFSTNRVDLVGRNKKRDSYSTPVKLAKEKAIISDKAVYPERARQKKKHLESSLIERIAVDPKDVDAYKELGELYMERESWSDAKECYKQILKLAPDNEKAKSRMIMIERELN